MTGSAVRLLGRYPGPPAARRYGLATRLQQPVRLVQLEDAVQPADEQIGALVRMHVHVLLRHIGRGSAPSLSGVGEPGWLLTMSNLSEVGSLGP